MVIISYQRQRMRLTCSEHSKNICLLHRLCVSNDLNVHAHISGHSPTVIGFKLSNRVAGWLMRWTVNPVAGQFRQFY